LATVWVFARNITLWKDVQLLMEFDLITDVKTKRNHCIETETSNFL